MQNNVEPKRTVLVADDESFQRMVIVEALGIVGNIDVIEASDGLSAYSQIVDRQPDLAIIDLHMPRMGGIELLQTLDSNDARPPGLKVLIASALVRRGLVEELRELGVDGLLIKPFTIRELIDTVERLTRPAPSLA